MPPLCEERRFVEKWRGRFDVMMTWTASRGSKLLDETSRIQLSSPQRFSQEEEKDQCLLRPSQEQERSRCWSGAHVLIELANCIDLSASLLYKKTLACCCINHGCNSCAISSSVASSGNLQKFVNENNEKKDTVIILLQCFCFCKSILLFSWTRITARIRTSSRADCNDCSPLCRTRRFQKGRTKEAKTFRCEL